MNEKVREWMRGPNTGQSSMSILVFMEGMGEEWLGRWGYSVPHDPSDLWRCLQLLEAAPEYAARMPEMAAVSAEWAVFATHWDELVAVYQREAANGDRAPKCYAMMQTLESAPGYPPLTCPNCGQVVGSPDWKAHSRLSSMRWDKTEGWETRWVEILCGVCNQNSHVDLKMSRTY